MLEGLTRADLAFRAEEAELEELFRTAWGATLRVMLPDPSTLRPEVERSIRLSNAALDLLLFDFLNELLYYKDAEGLLLDLGRLRVGGAAGGYLLEAEACGQAAAMAVETNTTNRRVNVKQLQSRLKKLGAYLPNA